MIIYNPELNPNLLDYGITIPLLDDRADKCFEALKKIDPSLSYFDLNDISPITKNDLLLCHTNEYVEKLLSVKARLAILETFELVDAEGKYYRYDPTIAKKELSGIVFRAMLNASVTYQTCLNALSNGFSFFLGGGMHHAMSFEGRGFCLINDIVIAIRKLQNENGIGKALIIDVDAHKGDGTAQLTENDDLITTLSIHMADAWPLDDKSDSNPSLISSTLDIPMKIGEENLYIQKLKEGLDYVGTTYDFALVVNGADPYELDELESSAGIKLTKEQMLERDLLVYNFLKQNKIPQAYVMAGGYGKRSWEIYYQFLKEVLYS